MTRRNLCPNPGAKNNSTGWSGSAAPARVTGLAGFPVTTGMKSSGSGFITSPTGVCASGDQLVVSLYQQSPTALGNKTVYAAFTRLAGGDDFSQTFLTNLDGTVKRTTATVTAPALATGVYLLLDAVPTDVVMTAVMFEPGAVDGGYADGDSVGWAWDGADGNSASSEQDLPAEGAAAFIMDLAVAGSGERASAGVAAFALDLAAVAAGERLSAGVAGLALDLALDVHGARQAAGVAELGLGLTVAAASGANSPARGPWIISRNQDPRIVTRVQVAS